MTLKVAPISDSEHLTFIRSQSSVSFLQTPAWGRVKTEWRSESLGWYDAHRLVGAGLVLHRPIPGLTRASSAYIPQGPAINWTGEIGGWLKPLCSWLNHTKTWWASPPSMSPRSSNVPARGPALSALVVSDRSRGCGVGSKPCRGCRILRR